MLQNVTFLLAQVKCKCTADSKCQKTKTFWDNFSIWLQSCQILQPGSYLDMTTALGLTPDSSSFKLQMSMMTANRLASHDIAIVTVAKDYACIGMFRITNTNLNHLPVSSSTIYSNKLQTWSFPTWYTLLLLGEFNMVDKPFHRQ